MRIEILDPTWEHEYEAFILSHPDSLLYVSNMYRKLLKAFLGEQDRYFLAIDHNQKIVGALPTFIKTSDLYGKVLNSLPFYGSHGSILEFKGDRVVRKNLLAALHSYSVEQNIAATTIITSPFEADFDFYETEASATFRDERIGQLTLLPQSEFGIEDKLFSLYHYKTRNMVRKAQKRNVTIVEDGSDQAFHFLVEEHHLNMHEIGGIPKPQCFFDLVRTRFEYGQDYKVFVAYLEGQPISALLLLYFNKTIEYFTPVVVRDFREHQPLSLIIFEAMKDGVKRGYKWWNWGGTWLNQDGVYQFKKRWGTENWHYYYYTRVYDRSLLNLTKTELLKTYPYFYVIPFGRLER